jgi:hypothetical protein
MIGETIKLCLAGNGYRRSSRTENLLVKRQTAIAFTERDCDKPVNPTTVNNGGEPHITFFGIEITFRVGDGESLVCELKPVCFLH